MNPPPPLIVGPLTRTDLVRYAGASGDFNPIHHDELFARDAGLPAPLSLGMLQAGMLATWATDWLGTENIRRFRVRFADRVFPGDTVTCSADALGLDLMPTVGFALVTHAKLMQSRRLLDTLNRGFHRPPIAWHHDTSKCSDAGVSVTANVTRVRPSLLTGWGTFGYVEAALASMQVAFESPQRPDWIVLISNADYPIKPADRIADELAACPYDACLVLEPVVYRQHTRAWQLACYDRYVARRVKLPVWPRTLALRHPRWLRDDNPFVSELVCFAGPTWLSLNRRACEHVLDAHVSMRHVATHYRRQESHGTVCADESYWHTLIGNSSLRVSQNNFRYVDWTAGGPHPKVLGCDDLARIKASDAHFARKFDSDIDEVVLDRIDAECL